MTHSIAKIHPAMTAIAAAIALFSTPLFAQSTDVPIDPTATPIVDTTPAPAVADPIAPAIDTTTAADPVVTKATSTTPAREATAAKTTAARSRPATARASTTALTAAPVAAIAAPVAQAPAVQPLPIEPIATAPVAARISQAPATATTIDVIPTVGLVALGLLVLAGGALAIRSRRRRRAEEAEDGEWQQQRAAEPEAVAEPAMIEPQPGPPMVAEPELLLGGPALAKASAPEPTPASETKFIGPTTDLPEHFDRSRFGFNVQVAYKGPTADNPSLSLKHRLRRASGMDQQERKLDAEVEAATGEPVLVESDLKPPVEAQAAEPTVAPKANGDFMFSKAGK